MYLDNSGYVVMEEVGAPGNTGDSAAESGRLYTLRAVLGDKVVVDLSGFITEKGLLRHPESPWREDDMSSDQISPLITAAFLQDPKSLEPILTHIRKNHYRTGNGNLITPGLYANIRRAENRRMLWLSDLAVLGQTLIFKLPIRWSDSKKWFEKNNESSADYLNWINNIAFAKAKGKLTWPLKLSLVLIPKDKVLEKIKHYYKNEPHSDWVINLYEKVIEDLYAF